MARSVEIYAPMGKAWFSVIEGTVKNHQTQRWAETHVHASGGGGYVHSEYGGQVAAPTVYSRVVNREHTQFWVEEAADGRQSAFTLPNSSLPVAEGHVVKIVWGGRKGSQGGDILYARNQTSGQEMATSSANLWHWAFVNSLAQYPLIYRMLFYYLPLLVVAYILAVFAPVIVTMTNENILPHTKEVTFPVIVDAFQQHFNYLHLWKWQLAQKELLRLDASAWIAIGIFTLVLSLTWKLVGYLVFGWWLRPLIVHPLKKTVRKLAEGPANESTQ